jgi:hypothetical protein
MNDGELIRAEKLESRQELYRKLADEVERHATKASVADEVVEVVREELKDETQVISVLEPAEQPDCK